MFAEGDTSGIDETHGITWESSVDADDCSGCTREERGVFVGCDDMIREMGEDVLMSGEHGAAAF